MKKMNEIKSFEKVEDLENFLLTYMENLQQLRLLTLIVNYDII